MSMHEAICCTCGAINHGDSHTCWRCLGQVHATAEPATAQGSRSSTA